MSAQKHGMRVLIVYRFIALNLIERVFFLGPLDDRTLRQNYRSRRGRYRGPIPRTLPRGKHRKREPSPPDKLPLDGRQAGAASAGGDYMFHHGCKSLY